MAQFVLKIEKLSHIMGPGASQDLRSPSPIMAPDILRQTHYEKSDWSRAFNQFIIACELDMINAISTAEQQILHLSCQVQRLPGY